MKQTVNMLRHFKALLWEFVENFSNPVFFYKKSPTSVSRLFSFPNLSINPAFFQTGYIQCVSPTVVVIQRRCWISLPSNIQVSVPVFPCSQTNASDATSLHAIKGQLVLGEEKNSASFYWRSIWSQTRMCSKPHRPPSALSSQQSLKQPSVSISTM